MLIAFTMFSSLFAGMYGVTMKYVIDKIFLLLIKLILLVWLQTGFILYIIMILMEDIWVT